MPRMPSQYHFDRALAYEVKVRECTLQANCAQACGDRREYEQYKNLAEYYQRWLDVSLDLAITYEKLDWKVSTNRPLTKEEHTWYYQDEE